MVIDRLHGGFVAIVRNGFAAWTIVVVVIRSIIIIVIVTYR